ncbi:hypothetical protein Pfo_002222 [Paulownia fortunei]|nr:hypothetical protein Pfo_002222 [Paulownia fortunei]
MKSKGKKKVVINKEETAENWCFVCKDGGDIRICDYKQCLKSYHPRCVGKDDSFLKSENHWACAWHTCFLCRRSSYLHCYTCTNAVCRCCLPAADFLQVKGKNGFCNTCLKLALLIEENKDYDSDGDRVDFTDRETYEGLFMEYYNIIKKEEEFESGDLYAAQDRAKMTKNHQSGSGSEEFDEEEQISDYDGVEYEKKCRKTRKEKRSERQKSAMQTPMKSNKKEFTGWASGTLIEFLTSIGKSSSEKLSQHEVTSIVNEYVKETKLFHPEKRKMIICDARLQPLFRRRTISRYRVYDLLEAHFAENHNESEEDELGYDSEDNNAGILSACKRQRKLDMENKSRKEELENNVPQSCFASIVVENVKLVYLKRSLLHELLKQPESFEEKVTGCFVRVKSDPYDYLSRNSHQLMQVKGVKTVSMGENNTEIVLLFSAMPKEIGISLLSDDDFSEEECEDLRQKVLAGELERPTVGDLQQKAKILHKDLTKHWISKELALLQNLIDRANEKGWRRELFEYLEKKKKLQTPSEQSWLLANVPTVIPDIYELNSNSGDIIDDMKSDKGSPKSILQCNSSVPLDGWQNNKASEEKTQHGHASPPERTQPISERSTLIEPQYGHTPNSELEHDNITRIEPLQLTAEVKRNTVEAEESLMCSQEMHCKQATRKGHEASKIEVIELLSDDENADDWKASYILANQKIDDLEGETLCIQGPNGERGKYSLSVLKRWSETSPYASKFKVWKEDQNEENAIWLPEAISIAFPKN